MKSDCSVFSLPNQIQIIRKCNYIFIIFAPEWEKKKPIYVNHLKPACCAIPFSDWRGTLYSSDIMIRIVLFNNCNDKQRTLSESQIQWRNWCFNATVVAASGCFLCSPWVSSPQGQGAPSTTSDHRFGAHLFTAGVLWDIIKFTFHPNAVL